MGRALLPGCALLLAWALLLALLSLPSAAIAQGESGESGSGDFPSSPFESPDTDTGAPADSLGQSPMDTAQGEQAAGGGGGTEQPATPATTGFHPTYSSKFDINRRTQTWTQQMSFNTSINGVVVNNSTNVSIGEDTSLDRDQRQRNSTTTLTYSYSENLKVSGSLGFTRNLTADSRTKTSVTADRFSGKLDYTRPLFVGVKGVFAFNAGTQRDKREDPLTSNRASNGPYAEATAGFDYAATGWDWKFTSRYKNSSLESKELQTGITTQDSNTNADIGMTVNIKVPGLTKFTLNANRDLSQTQQPLSQTRTGENNQVITEIVQETTEQLNRGFSLDVGTAPIRHLDLTARYTFRNNGVDRVFDTGRSQESLDRTFSSSLSYLFPDSTKVTSNFDWGVARSLYEDPTRTILNGDTKSRALNGSVERALGRRTKLDASGGLQLQSYYFDDTERNLDDRDVLRGDFAARADYIPMRKMTTSMRFAFEHNQTIYIDRSKSSGNTTQQTYTVNPSVSYDLTPRVRLREDAAVVAIARVFDFDEDRNKLSRNTEFRTSVEADIYTRLDMEMRYVHRTVLDGSYRRDEIDGLRKFGKSSESITQDLTLRLDYRPLAGSQIYFRVNRRVGDSTTRRQQAGGFEDVTTTTVSTEIEGGGNLSHTLSNGVRLNARLRRVQNWDNNDRRNNFFVGEITVGYNF